MNKSVLLSISASLALGLILGIHFSIGSYYESYEVFNNYLNNLAICTPGVVEPISNETFVLRQLLMLIQKLFPQYEMNSIGYLFFIFIGMTSVYYCLISLINDKLLLFIALGISSILFAEHIIIINTTRISFIIGLGAILMLFLPNFIQSRLNLFAYIFLSILSIFCRVEIGAITAFTGIVFVLTNKKLLLPFQPVFFSFLFSLLCFIFFVIYNYIYCPYVYDFSSVERKILYHQNIIYNEKDILELFTKGTSKPKTYLDFANAMLILDEPKLNHRNATNILKQKSFIGYVYNEFPLFRHVYVLNFLGLLSLCKGNIMLLLSILLLFLALLFNPSTRKKVTIVLSMLTFILLPFVILVNVGINERFFCGYLTFYIVFFAAIFFIWYNKNGQIKKLISLIVLLLVGINLYLHASKKIKEYKDQEVISYHVLQNYNTECSVGNHPFFLSIPGFSVFPAKLFSPLNNSACSYKFVTLSVIDYTGFMRKRNETIFGSNYMSLLSRIKYVKKSSKYLYANQYELEFLKGYLKNVYDYDIKFQLEDDFSNYQSQPSSVISKYKIIS